MVNQGRHAAGRPGARATDEPRAQASLSTPLPPTLEVGGGTAIWLEGSCVAAGRRIAELALRVGANEATAKTHGAPPPGKISGGGWWQALVPIAAIGEPEAAPVDLRVRLADGAESSHRLATLRLVPGPPARDPAAGGSTESDLVAICLATYDPPVELLRRQVESIRRQTHRNWTCIVSDDCSPLERWRELVEIVGDDDRFRLHRAGERGGFYLNFERALRAVPAAAAFVAFADQDDRWDEDKLESLIAALGPHDALAHSDARVVDESGTLIAPTFWPRGAPRDDRLASLLRTSAVTGASCLFRAPVLDLALPFPPPVGAAYHDRWVSLVAAALGGIAYVDRPLYDYVQHPGATLGHAAATEGRPHGERRIAGLRRRLAALRRRRFHPNWRAAHDDVVVRTVQEAEVLWLRLGDRMSPADRAAVDRVARLPDSLPAQLRVLGSHPLGALRRRPGRQGALLRGVAWRRLVGVRRRLQGATRKARAPLAALAPAARAAGLKALGALVALRAPVPGRARRLVHVRATKGAERRLRRELERDGATGARSGPEVSIVIPSRDGRTHLARLIPALERTRYRPFEVVVVDSGSTDGSAEWLRTLPAGFPLETISQTDPLGFAEAVNRGVAATAGELVLLLNNDVEPATPEWLGLMVETLEGRDAACAGARLVYPRRPGLDNAGDEVFDDLTLQHRGIHFVGDPEGVPRPRNLGAGEDPLAPAASEVREVPAVTAACMLIRRQALEAAGALDEGYRFGTEDTDLCLTLRERGERIVYDGRATLFHHEFGTQNVAGREAKRANRAHNRRRFADRWGRRLHRLVLADRLAGARSWSEEPLRIGITVTHDSPGAGHGDYYTAHELGDALGRLGFRVAYLETRRGNWRRRVGSIDVLISLLDAFPLDEAPPGVVSLAWVRNWTERWIERPWFDDYDIVLASSERSRRLIEERSSQAARLMPLATNPDRFRPSGRDRDLAADLVFAGSHWGAERDVERVLPQLAADVDVKAFGRGWDAVAEMDGCHAGRLEYDRLPAAYSSATVVVDDSAHHTRPYGAVNSRVFDALACGTLVASNDVEGVRELFDEDFPVWHDAESLRAHVDAARDDPDRIAGLIARYRAEVLANHTYAHRAREIREALLGWCAAPRFGICVGVPSRDVAESWGDYHYARAIQRQLERRGLPARVHLLPDWERAHPAVDDVCLHLFGLSTIEPRAGQLSVIWNISHPELVTPDLLDRYDLALIASPSFADELAGRTATAVHALAQATDPERFRPDPGAERYELLFVGNSRGASRPIVAEAARSEHELTVYGGGWTAELIDPRVVAGSTIPNAELRRHYSGAAIVLNDHWPDMREHGFISNRLYDALACGACVVSDHVDGIEEEFDGAVVTVAGADELRAAIDRLIADPGERSERGERGRRAVLDRHTFERRVDELVGWVLPLLDEDAGAGAPGGGGAEAIAAGRS